MPGPVTSFLRPILSRAAALRDDETLFHSPVGGGSINDTYQVSTKDNKRWFCKFNQAAGFPGLFEKEARGLALLGRLGPLRVPAVIACEAAAGQQVLVLEWIREGPRSDAFWRLFGEQLAQLHRVTRPLPGLEENNYMGALPQDNSPVTPDLSFPDVASANQIQPRITPWSDFFIQRRLRPQVHLAASHGLLDTTALRHFERLYRALPGIFGEEEPPSLLHGDLWSGNFLCDSSGQPVLIDPAVYYGHRCMDLAMTTLFGGFGSSFYESYAYHYPLPVNYRQQWEIANLYPLLIHLNLFGKSYSGDIIHTIQRF
jgi:protein-ribulosamine 3-kinase